MQIWLSLLLALMMVPAWADEAEITDGNRSVNEADSAKKEKDSVKETTTGDSMTIWIDVRTAEEFAQGHIPGSINIPYEIIGGEIAGITRDVDKDIRVYCRSGRRSGVAMDTLRGMGYENVINEGGYEDLLRRKAQGEPIP
jgi:phage shock protein E